MNTATARPIKPGRPRKDGAARRRYFEGQLYTFLQKKMPHHIDGRGILAVSSLAAAWGCSRQAVYDSMNKDRLSPELAAEVIKDSKGRISAEELAPFLIA